MQTRLVLCASVLAALVLAGCPKNPSNPTSPTNPEEKKGEPAKTEAAKTGPAKTEAAKTEAAKTEAAKTEAAKTEAAKTEAAKTEAAKTEAAKAEPAVPDKAVVELSTTMGKIKLQLDGKKAPQTVANFLQYVRSGHYSGTIFHRVISTFMIQGGGFDANMVEKPTRPPIQNEAQNGLSNERGTVAMARTPNPHSAGAQFFINVKDNPNLNHRDTSLPGWGYCVFGKVIEGMDVVDKIKDVETEVHGAHENVPKTPVVINEAKIVRP